MSVGSRLALLLLASASVLPATTVEERLNQLEARVSEMQLLLEQLSQKKVSPRSSRPVPVRSQPGLTYQIRSGDSYWSIARRHGTTVEALTKANPDVHPRRLTIGRTITLPGTNPSPRKTTPGGKPVTTTTTYKVRPGDVMGRIAGNHGISLAELRKANPGIDPRRLRIGKILTIPGQQPFRRPPAETKSGIPEDPEPAVTREQPSSENPYQKALDSSTKVAREVASSPGGEESNEVPPADLDRPRLVTLDKDLRFSEVARQHQTTVAQLNELNRRELSPEQMIKAGSQLYIPVR